MHKKEYIAHALAIFTIIVWGATFISTKLLLNDFSPVDILIFRFAIGFVALCVAYPKRMRIMDRKHELYFIGAGAFGVTLYFLFENIALTYSYASNVGVIISVVPFFTAIVSKLFYRDTKLRPMFFIGFAVAMVGIILISFNGLSLQLNPLGDILALCAALTWAFYSLCIKKLDGFGYHPVHITRRAFLYGLLLMLPLLYPMGFTLDLGRFAQSANLLNMLFLGLIASALCFATWSVVVSKLGPIRSSVYIYAIPVVTVVLSAIVLRESITPLAMAGTALTIVGLVVSERA